jgi:hypothetical protein
MSEKVCTGHYCKGKLRPLIEFYVHGSGIREGKPFSRCKRCWRWQVDHPKGTLRDRVPMPTFMPVYDELVRRIGQTQAARRIGVAVDTISRRRLNGKESVELETFDKAVSVLEVARANGEDGWSTELARIGNLTDEDRQRGWQNSAKVRRERVQRRLKRKEKKRRKLAIEVERLRREKDLAEWRRLDKECEQLELAMDVTYCQARWAYDAIDGGWPLADLECRHARLPGDKTTPCGCWPGESV